MHNRVACPGSLCMELNIGHRPGIPLDPWGVRNSYARGHFVWNSTSRCILIGAASQLLHTSPESTGVSCPGDTYAWLSGGCQGLSRPSGSSLRGCSGLILVCLSPCVICPLAVHFAGTMASKNLAVLCLCLLIAGAFARPAQVRDAAPLAIPPRVPSARVLPLVCSACIDRLTVLCLAFLLCLQSV
jgi:hypothetical protein